jgi:hypothetical protein
MSIPDPEEKWDLQDGKDHVDLADLKVVRDLADPLVHMELKGLPESWVLLEYKDQLVKQDPWDLLEPLELMELLDLLDHKDPPDLKDLVTK